MDGPRFLFGNSILFFRAEINTWDGMGICFGNGNFILKKHRLRNFTKLLVETYSNLLYKVVALWYTLTEN